MASDTGPFASVEDFVAFFNAFGKWMIASEQNVASEARSLGQMLAANVAKCEDLKRYNADAMNLFGAQTMLLGWLKTAGVTGIPDSPPFPALFADKVAAIQTPTGGIAISADLACDKDGYATAAARLNTGPTPVPAGGVLAGLSSTALNGLGALPIAAFQSLVEACGAAPEVGFFCIVFGGLLAFVAAKGIDGLVIVVPILARSVTGVDKIQAQNESLKILAGNDAKRTAFAVKCFNDAKGFAQPLAQARALMQQCVDNSRVLFPDRAPPTEGLGFLGALAILTGVVVGGVLLVQISQRKSKAQEEEIATKRQRRFHEDEDRQTRRELLTPPQEEPA